MVDAIFGSAGNYGGHKGSDNARYTALALVRNRLTPIQYRFFTLFWDPKDLHLMAANVARLALLTTHFIQEGAQANMRWKAHERSQKLRDGTASVATTFEKKGFERVQLKFLDPDGAVLAEQPYPSQRALSKAEVAALAPGERERTESAEASFAGFAGIPVRNLNEDQKLVLRWVIGFDVTDAADPGAAPIVVSDPGTKGTKKEKAVYQTYLGKKATWDAKDSPWGAALSHEDGKLRIERNVGGTSPFEMTESELKDGWVDMALSRLGVKSTLIKELATARTIGYFNLAATKNEPLYKWLTGLDKVTDADTVHVKAQTLYVWHAGGRTTFAEAALKKAYQDFAVAELTAVATPQKVGDLQDATLKAIVMASRPTITDDSYVSWSGGKLRIRTKGDRTFTMDELLTAAQSVLTGAELPDTTGLSTIEGLTTPTADSSQSIAGNVRTALDSLKAGTPSSTEVMWSGGTWSANATGWCWDASNDKLLLRDTDPTNEVAEYRWPEATVELAISTAVDTAGGTEASKADILALYKAAPSTFPATGALDTGSPAVTKPTHESVRPGFDGALALLQSWKSDSTYLPARVGPTTTSHTSGFLWDGGDLVAYQAETAKPRQRSWAKANVEAALPNPTPAGRPFAAMVQASPFRYSDVTDEQLKLALQNLGGVEPNDEFEWSASTGLKRTRRVAGGNAQAEVTTFDADSVKRACATVVLVQPALDYLKTVTSATYVSDLQDDFAARAVKGLSDIAAGTQTVIDSDSVSWTSAGLLVQAKPSSVGEDAVRDGALTATRIYANSTTAEGCFAKAFAGIQSSFPKGTNGDQYFPIWRGACNSDADGRTKSEDEYWSYHTVAQVTGAGSRVAQWKGMPAVLGISGPPEVYPEADWPTTKIKVQCQWVPKLDGTKPDTSANSIVEDIKGIGATKKRIRDLDPRLTEIVVQLRDPGAAGVALLGSDHVKVDGSGTAAKLVKDISTKATSYDLPEVVTIERAITEKVTVEPRYPRTIAPQLAVAGMDSAAGRGVWGESLRAFAEFAYVDYGGYDLSTYSFKPLNVPTPKTLFASRSPQTLTFRTGYMSQTFLYNWCANADYGEAGTSWKFGKPSLRKDGIIFMLDRGGLPLRMIKFAGAFPLSWSGASLDAYGGSQPLDEITLVCDRLRITHIGVPGVI